MSYWIHETGTNKNNSLWRFYMCDFTTDIGKLPTATKQGDVQPNDTVSSYVCAPGSQCLCQEDGSMWLLGKDTDKWTKRTSSSGGGGSSSEENIESITNSQIQSLFS